MIFHKANQRNGAGRSLIEEQAAAGRYLIALIGVISSLTLSSGGADERQRFILRNPDGFFSVHLEPVLVEELRPVLQPQVAVCVVGRLAAYYQRRRQTYQVVVEAASVTPVESDQPVAMTLSSPLLLIKQITEYITASLSNGDAASISSGSPYEPGGAVR